MKRILTITSACLLLAGGCLWPQAQGQSQPAAPAQAKSSAPPLTKAEVIKGLKSKKEAGQIMSEISQRGVDFELTEDIIKELHKAKADDATIDIIRKAGPKAREEAAKSGGGATAVVSPEEGQAFQAIRNELDPEKEIQLVKDFETKYPNSNLLSYVYYFGMNAYQQKNNIAEEIALGEKSLKLNPDFLPSLIMVSSMLPQPQFLNSHPNEKEKYLDEAGTYADKALKQIDDPKVFVKQPSESDEQYGKRKNEAASNVHAALGMIHLERSQLGLQGLDKDELTKAEKEFEQAVTMSEKPSAQDYYRLGEAYSMDNKIDEAIQAFTKAGDIGTGTVIKTYADQRIQELQKRKTQPQPATKP